MFSKSLTLLPKLYGNLNLKAFSNILPNIVKAKMLKNHFDLKPTDNIEKLRREHQLIDEALVLLFRNENPPLETLEIV
jgi:hypothetical protein